MRTYDFLAPLAKAEDDIRFMHSDDFEKHAGLVREDLRSCFHTYLYIYMAVSHL